ncbi:MAG TPA: RNA polymerase sigma factor [Phycisphaerae bacterium]|nr:RNA polymerase sigma factor [Phycisphaerae bacterium]
MTPLSDEALLGLHVSGDTGALDELIRRHAGEVYGFLCKFVGSGGAADDLVQETFLQIHLAASSFDPQRSFKPWLYTIAANKARDFLRSRSRRREHSLDATADRDEGGAAAGVLPSAEAPLDEHVASEEQRKAVREVIAEMSESSRMILTLGYFQQLPYAEIAEILEIPVGTVKSRLHTAVRQFAKRWEERTNAGVRST